MNCPRLLCPWDFSGKNTGVGCRFLLHCIIRHPVLLPGKFHGWRNLIGYSPWSCKERTRLSDFASLPLAPPGKPLVLWPLPISLPTLPFTFAFIPQICPGVSWLWDFPYFVIYPRKTFLAYHYPKPHAGEMFVL